MRLLIDQQLQTETLDSGERQCPALLLSASSSGQGKTTLTAALARHHRNAGRRVRVFKTGPDFLDPMILGRAAGSGTEAEPLDLWMVGEPGCRRARYQAAGVSPSALSTSKRAPSAK